MKRLFFLAILLGVVLQMTAQVNNLRQPAFLKKGDKVAMISPSYTQDIAVVRKAADIIRGWGLVPVFGENVEKVYAAKFAGTPEQRAHDLRWALEDESIKAIICNRGGYGAIHNADYIPLDIYRQHPKWLVGFSDITTLHSFEATAGVMSLHATMPKEIAETGGTDLSSTMLKDLLFGNVPEYHISAHPMNISGHAEGTLVGGNLCVLSALGGSSWDATNLDNIILFIEDVGENMRNIDRLFNTLRVRGVFSRVKGVIIGEFSDAKADIDFPSVEAMLRPYVLKYNIPLCCGFPVGHGDTNLPLIHGANLSLDVSEEGSVLKFHVEGQPYRLFYPQ